MTNRYGDAPIIYTRVGISLDTFLQVVSKYNTGFNRNQFAEVTQLKITSLRDKLRDLELYGLIKQVAKDTYAITDDGNAIIAGGLQRKVAIESAINRSPLWKQLMATIGTNPERALFDKTIRSIPTLSNIHPDFLDNLWYAYNADIACITKSPPFANRQPLRTFTLHMPVEYAIKPASIPTPNPQSQIDEEEIKPGTVEYRGHKVTVTDDLTAKFAESLIMKMIKDLKRKGVEFDE